MRRFGIDTSRHQGDFDFAKAMQEHNVEYAILKIGGADEGLYMDSQFENSYNKCVKAGLPKGAYFFGHAMNMEEAKKEADYLIGLLKGRQFEYPIFYDVEADMLTLDKHALTEICLCVLRTVQTAGYWVGIYTSDSHFEYNVDDTKLKGFSHWVASYSATEPVLESGSQLQMWQFGGTLNLIRSNKINGQTVDQNYCYVDYPTLIKAKGLNGFVKEQPKKEEPKPNTATYTVVSGDSYWAIAEKLGDASRFQEIQQLNNGKPLFAGNVIIIPNDMAAPKAESKKDYREYVVKAGDSFWAIADSEMGDGAKMYQLANFNGMTIESTIHKGQVLKIPM